MRKGLKKFFCAMMVMVWMTALAIPAMAAPKIQEAEYDGNGIVDVEFATDVVYKNPKVTVTDSTGKAYSVKMSKRDSDDLSFKIVSFRKGVTYTFKISGIRKKTEKSYSTITGRVKIPAPAAKPVVKSVEYDRGDAELEIDFKGNVVWKSPTVVVTDGKTNYVTRIYNRDNDEIEVKVKSLTKGKKYTYKITGIRGKDSTTYTTVTGTFIPKR